MSLRRLALAGAGLLVVAALVALGVSVLQSGSPSASTGGRPNTSGGPTSSIARSHTPPPSLLKVKAVYLAQSPRGVTGVPGGGKISVSFSAALARNTPHPRLVPSTPGAWKQSGRTMTFTPARPYLPLTEVALSVPSGAAGVVSSDGAHLGRRYLKRFQVANGSTLRLKQLLSLLQYSPLAWTSAGPSLAPGDTAVQLKAIYRPPAGTFAWRQRGWPSQLTSLWQPATFGVMTRGLVMSFQADHGLVPNGDVNRALWAALVNALATRTLNTGGYNYALGSKGDPESLTVWHDGSVVIHVPANTGIAASPTPDGNFPVYTRLRSQVMRGTNPDGVKYADPVQYVAYFYESDAVHYLARASYGIPQSLGCIELSLADAARVWPYLAYGTIVTVTG